MNTIGLYNTDLQLWFNYFKSNPDHNMTFLDGHVLAPDGDVLARFPTNDNAMKVLNLAREYAKNGFPAQS